MKAPYAPRFHRPPTPGGRPESSESEAGIDRNRRPVSVGIGGRNQAEYPRENRALWHEIASLMRCLSSGFYLIQMVSEGASAREFRMADELFLLHGTIAQIVEFLR